MSTEMIKITGLKKSYGSLEVLKGIDLTIAENGDKQQYSPNRLLK